MGLGRFISKRMPVQKTFHSNMHFAIHWNADMSETTQFFLQRNMICLFNISWKNNQMQTFVDATNTTKLHLKLSSVCSRPVYIYWESVLFPGTMMKWDYFSQFADNVWCTLFRTKLLSIFMNIPMKNWDKRHTLLHFKAFGMINLHYEIRIWKKNL